MNSKKENNRDYEINFLALLRELVSKWWLILLAIACAAGLMFCYTQYLVTPQYTSTVLFYVNNGPQKSDDKISSSDISASQSLVDTYIVILKYGTTLDEVILNANLDYTPSQLAKEIQCSAVNDTEVFQVQVTDPDPEKATRIARSIERILPQKVADVIEGSAMRIVRNASIPTNPSSPNMKKNLALGVIVCFILSVGYIALRYLLDDRIRDAAKFIKEQYNHPVLAVIPDLQSDNSSKYYYSQKEQ